MKLQEYKKEVMDLIISKAHLTITTIKLFLLFQVDYLQMNRVSIIINIKHKQNKKHLSQRVVITH